ncbi:MAG: SusD/RagB family nutrient-binding outer membrane lipoprotein [Prevotella sp.]|nr:SusD/RagB family nutrient-binding outer membrane lipoprotein [Prevotella sp.]MDY5927583.1 SusD/RagB family nutrient-binding outer membrane lipoprotein [Prevotella sp.]
MKKSILNIGMVCVLGLSLAACTDNFDSMNQDPMGITNSDPSYVMPYIQEQGAHIASWEYQVGDNLHTNLYAQYFANSASYFNSDNYTYNSGWVTDGFWNNYYSGVLKQVKAVAETVKKLPAYDNIYQTMRIYAASCTAMTTDVFGDIPYSEAATGRSDAKYDSQKDIYAAVFKELTEAAAALNSNKADQAAYKDNQDLIYNGDMKKWVRLANSLRLRYALRLVYVDPALAKQEGEAALAATGGLLQSNDDNAGVYISGTGANGWPLFQISGWGEFCMSKTMEDMLKTTSGVADPRMPLWFGHTNGSTAENPEFKGIPNGLATSDLSNYPAEDRSYVWGLQAMPGWNSKNNSESSFCVPIRQKVMSYAEVCLLKAEAALRGWNGAGDAKANYLAGIKASFEAERAMVSDASLYSTANDNTYMTTGKVEWKGDADFETHLEQIITQKWLALYPNGTEAWTEFRRTGYPKLTPVKVSMESTINAANGEFVKKLRYVDDELRENPNASDKSLNGGKGDGMNVRVWWDAGNRYK